MTRKKRDYVRPVLPDPKYGDEVVSKMVNSIMRSGKKSVAERVFYNALDMVKEKSSSNPIEVFHVALGNVRPLVEVRSRRVGGATYQVPSEVRARRADALAIRWMIGACNNRSERTLDQRLANEILDASNNRGGSVKKKEDTHRMAEANKAFSHFRW
jgi:small subunit ribosomal protein S7